MGQSAALYRSLYQGDQPMMASDAARATDTIGPEKDLMPPVHEQISRLNGNLDDVCAAIDSLAGRAAFALSSAPPTGQPESVPDWRGDSDLARVIGGMADRCHAYAGQIRELRDRLEV